MALSITQQIGALAGTPIPLETGNTNLTETTAIVSAAFVWKSSMSSLQCKVQKPNIVDFSPSPLLSPCRSPMLKATQADFSMMMLLDSVMMNNVVNKRKAMNAILQVLKSVGVRGS